jgi:CubicO group peptidase (beta-lactamase class C family)
MKEQKVMGCSVALVSGNQTVWSEGFGYADQGNGIMATCDTRYLIGSTSRLFTGTAIMQIVDAGKTDAISLWKNIFPNFPHFTTAF